MLLKDIYNKKHYAFFEKAASWQEAIKLCCQPIEADGTVTSEYADEIIACIEEHGPYIVILPGVAMPHSTENSTWAKDTTIAFMKLNEAVSFEEGDEDKRVNIFFTLASVDAEAHLANMQELYTVLTNEAVLQGLRELKTAEDLLSLDALLTQKEGGL